MPPGTPVNGHPRPGLSDAGRVDGQPGPCPVLNNPNDDKDNPDASAHVWRFPVLIATAFGVGVAVMAVEMGAARLIAPWYGSSTVVWAALISTVLGCMALGGLWGGWLSMGERPERALVRLLAGSGLAVAALPWLARPLLGGSIAAFTHGQVATLGLSLLLMLVSVGLPVALAGATSPLLVHLAVRGGARVGPAAARLGASGTIGSLVGTLLSGVVLVPLWGSATTLGVFGGVLLALAAALAGLRRRSPAALVLPGLLLALPAGLAQLVPAPGHARDHTLEVRESPIQHLRVTERGGLIKLVADEGFAIQSFRWRDGRLPLIDIWRYYALAPAWTSGGCPGSALLVGLGGGTAADLLHRLCPKAAITGVEIDAEVVALGRAWFGLPESTEVVVDDARRFLHLDRRRFDLIVVDAYRFPYIPFQLVTQEAFAAYEAHLAPGGAVVLNVGRPDRRGALLEAIVRTAASRLPVVRTVDAASQLNALVVATRHQPDADFGLDRLGYPARVTSVLRRLSAPVPRQAAPDAWLLTDERAPVEWLTDWGVAGRLLGGSSGDLGGLSGLAP